MFIWVDNSAALSALVRGYSSHVDAAVLCHSIWAQCARLQIAVWADRVESASNLADDPSRLDFTEVLSMGSTETKPALQVFSEISQAGGFFESDGDARSTTLQAPRAR